MIKLEELKEWADDLKPILFDINLAKNNLLILDDIRLNRFRINHFDNYLNIKYQQQFILIIQLAKIFSERDNTHKRNVNKLFNWFQTEPLNKDVLNFNNVFKNKDEIYTAINELREKMKVNYTAIESIKDLRDKVFAHTDPDETEKTIDIEVFKNLVELSNEIYNSLFGKILADEFNPNFGRRYDLRFIADLLE